jgi:hypothetical protein
VVPATTIAPSQTTRTNSKSKSRSRSRPDWCVLKTAAFPPWRFKLLPWALHSVIGVGDSIGIRLGVLNARSPTSRDSDSEQHLYLNKTPTTTFFKFGGIYGRIIEAHSPGDSECINHCQSWSSNTDLSPSTRWPPQNTSTPSQHPTTTAPSPTSPQPQMRAPSTLHKTILNLHTWKCVLSPPLKPLPLKPLPHQPKAHQSPHKS